MLLSSLWMILIYIYIYNSNLYIQSIILLVWKKSRLYNLQILQTNIQEKNLKRRKTHVLLENNQATPMSSQKKKHQMNYLS